MKNCSKKQHILNRKWHKALIGWHAICFLKLLGILYSTIIIGYLESKYKDMQKADFSTVICF